jgi:hypothetical protein
LTFFVFFLSLYNCYYLITVSSPAFTRVQAPKMVMEGVDVSALNDVLTNANLIATSVSDNAGYAFPAIGLVSLAALILYLAPPLVDE